MMSLGTMNLRKHKATQRYVAVEPTQLVAVAIAASPCRWAFRFCWAAIALLFLACDRPAQPKPVIASAGPMLPVLYAGAGRYNSAQSLWSTANVPVRAQLGRGIAPLAADVVSIVAPATITEPLALPTVWQLPSVRPLAAIAGTNNGIPQVELIDIDAGEVLWRDTTTCTAPIVAVTSGVVICGDGHGLRALDLQGAVRWTHPGQWVATSGTYLVVVSGERTEVINAQSGALERELKLPAGIAPATVRGVCRHSNGMDVVVSDGTTVSRLIAPRDPTGALTPTWTTPLAAIAVELADGVGACRDEWIVQGAAEQGVTLTSLSRLTGAAIARMADVTGLVRRRDDSLLVSTTRAVLQVNRRLVPLATDAAAVRQVSELPPFGRMLAMFGDVALVQTSPRTAMLLDATLHSVWFELSGQSAAIGNKFAVAGNGVGNMGESLYRYALPMPPRDGGLLPVSAPLVAPVPTRRAAPGYVAAELRDLPPAVPLSVDHAITAVGEATHWVGAALIDPAHPAQVYVVTLAQAPSNERHAGISLLDLGSKQWRWHAHDGCGVGAPLAIAKSASTLVCASQGNGATGAAVTATDALGNARWQWHGATIDAVTAKGRAVMLHHGHSVAILDDTLGELRGELSLLPSTPARAVLVAAADDAGAAPWLVAVQGNRVVVHTIAAGLLPLWAVQVNGVVDTLQAFGSSVVVSLEDGDSYVVDLATAAIRAVPTVNDRVMVAGDLLSSERLAPDGAWQQALLRPDASLLTRNEYAMVVTVPRAAVVAPKRRGPVPLAPRPLPPRVFYYPGAANYVRGGGNSELLLMFATTHVAAVAPTTGTPRVLLSLPSDATGVGFATEVDGQPRTGMLLRNPLRAVLF